MRKIFCIILTCSSFLLAKNSNAVPKFNASSKEQAEKSILKAKSITGNKKTNEIFAEGEVEVQNGQTTVTADKAYYNRNEGRIEVEGNVNLNDEDFGDLYSSKLQAKENLSSGKFAQTDIILSDGSYITADEVLKQNPQTYILQSPIFSICPDEEILQDKSKARDAKSELITIAAKNIKLDKENERIKAKHSVLKIKKFPIFYTPYLSIPLKKRERATGFLSPSYVNNSRLGFGLNIPYFIDFDDSINYTITPKLYSNNGQVIVENKIQQKLKYGQHETRVEIANNKITDQTDVNVVNRTEKDLRFDIRSNGKYIFSENSSFNHDIFTISDRNYLRDYNFDFRAFTESSANFDYVKNRDSLQVESVRFQELEEESNFDSAQFVLPAITYRKHFSNSLLFNETYNFEANATNVTRESGLQYRRTSLTPEIVAPFNLSGNLFELKARYQLDYYSLETNDRFNENSQEFDKSKTNQKPEVSLNWRLPLIKKSKSSTVIIEPHVNLVSSSFKNNFDEIPNEDSANSELSINNIFNSDRIAGYDRNEAGERVNYGATSTIFNKYGQFKFDLAQSLRFNDETQDVAIRGFGTSNKSNIVGQFSYILSKYFNLNYLFQLNESNFSNEVNSIIANFNYKKINISNDYLLIRRGIINDEKIHQNTIRVGYKFTPKIKGEAAITRNLISQTDLTRSLSLEYGGCCVAFRFTTSESNTDNLTETQRSHSINVVVKGF